MPASPKSRRRLRSTASVRPLEIVGRYPVTPSLDGPMVAAIRAMLEAPDEAETECEQIVGRIMTLVRQQG